MIDKKTTVAQIAECAGVSPATVSRVLNHREQVKADTIAKVESAMAALGFVSKPQPPSSQSRQKVILVNVVNLKNPFYGEVLQGILASAKAHNFYPLIYQERLDDESIKNFCGLVKTAKASGVLFLNQTPSEFLNLVRLQAPVVQCCDYAPDCDIPYVGINDFSAARNAVGYLLASGRKKIAFLNGPRHLVYSRERQKGYEKALEEEGVSLPSGWHVNLPKVDYEMGYSAACQLLNNENRPNAFFTSSDILASAVIRAARRFHLSVPQDIMVIGFDNRDISQMMIPSITTVSQPKFQLGYSACEMLIKRVEHPQQWANDSILLDTELIVRESTTAENP